MADYTIMIIIKYSLFIKYLFIKLFTAQSTVTVYFSGFLSFFFFDCDLKSDPNTFFFFSGLGAIGGLSRSKVEDF